MIGVYDSGFGGLGVLRHLLEALPERDFCYLGDAGRAPYGGRDAHTVLDFAEQAVERLFEEGCRLVVVACNTVSCVALRHLQVRYCPESAHRRILGVTIPGAEYAVAHSGSRAARPGGAAGHIGIVATRRTVESGTYVDEIRKLAPRRVTQLATPILVPLVEEGWEATDLARQAVQRYLRLLGDVEVLLLGCTHYPLLGPALDPVRKAGIRVLDPAPYVAERLVDWLDRHPGFDESGEGRLRVLCTGDPERFTLHGRRFLGRPLPPVEPVAEVKGRLAPHDPARAPRGQVVRPPVGGGHPWDPLPDPP